MKGLEPWVYLALLLVTGAVIFATTGNDDKVDLGEVVALDLKGEPLREIRMELGETTETVATLTGEGDEMRAWIRHIRRHKKKAAPAQEVSEVSPPSKDAGAGDAGDVAAEPEAGSADAGAPDVTAPPEVLKPPGVPEFDTDVREFPGNDRALEIARGAVTFKALRAFDGLSPKELEAMGLAEPSGTLTFKTASGEHTFKLGATAYGSGDMYATLDGTRVFLLPAKVVGPLKNARYRLQEKRMVPVKPADVDTVVAKAEGVASRELVASGSDADRHWRPKGAEIEDTSAFDSFVEKLMAVRVDRYHVSGEPEPAPIEAVLTAQFSGSGEPLTRVELARSEEKGKEVWLARTPTSRGWAKVNTGAASDVAEEFGALGGQ